jgi:transcriptional regulator with XRE-family HTH domain
MSYQEEKMKLAKMIRNARESKGFSQYFVSVAIGVASNAFVSKLERGEKIPSAKVARKLVQILELDAEALLMQMNLVRSSRLSEKFYSVVI